MIRKCAKCDKGEMTGKVVTRKGMAKAKGGTGSKVSRWSKRKFYANLQKVRIMIKGRATRVLLCAKCIKKGNFVKVV